MSSSAGLWTNLEPFNQSFRRYHFIDQNESNDSISFIDRGFLWMMPDREEVLGEAVDGVASLVRWSVGINVFIARQSRGWYDYAAEVAFVSNQFAFEVQKQPATFWPTGVQEVIVQPVQTSEDLEAEVASIQIRMSVLTEETI